jgi:hypothetical protein
MIRVARVQDLPWFLTEAAKFIEYHPSLKNADEGYLAEVLTKIIEEGLCLVAVEGMDIIGTIGGIVFPNYFDPSLVQLTELFWWVEEEHRGKKDSLRLFKLFESEAKMFGATQVIMTTTSHTPHLKKIFERSGYSEHECSYVKEL